MMVAMMVPAASPVILLFAEINRRRNEHQGTFVSTGQFLLGYLTAWTGFSVLATLAKWGLLTAALVSPMMESTSKALGGGLLLGAGLFQFSRLKYACLAHCRSPMGFLATEWQDGSWGAFRMGLKHGGYCLGCCWALMGLLFAFGVTFDHDLVGNRSVEKRKRSRVRFQPRSEVAWGLEVPNSIRHWLSSWMSVRGKRASLGAQVNPLRVPESGTLPLTRINKE